MHFHVGAALILGAAACQGVQTQIFSNTLASNYANRDWQAASDKAQQFVSNLTLEEKFKFIRGNLSAQAGGCIGNIEPLERMSFRGICLQDGPLALARNDMVSVFPAGVATAATWDRDLMYQRGMALGAEFRGKGAHVILGPVAGPIGRHSLGGRNWEGFSPDPYLTGVAMENTIRGIQNEGVQACSKHYIGNEQETQRTNTTLQNRTQVEALSSNIDDRTLHELYLWPFANAVRAGTASVMCSYNRLNQTYSCESSALLNNILKEELGFQGYVVSDWFATHSAANAANAGLDLEMPGVGLGSSGSFFDEPLQEQIKNGSVSTERLDDMVRRIMTPYFLLGQDPEGYPTPDPAMFYYLALSEFSLPAAKQLLSSVGVPFRDIQPRDVRGDHASLIREMGAAGTVLLKNTNGTLPLQRPSNIGVLGSSAADFLNGLMYQSTTIAPEIGPVAVGGGSGSGRFTTIVPPLEAIKAKARETGARVQYITNNTAIVLDQVNFYPTPDICLVFLSSFASEGTDRPTLIADANSTAMVQHITSYCPNTVIIVNGPGVVTMPWADNPNVTAILANHYPGQEIGNAIVDVLWGAAEPSGRLPYTIPLHDTDAAIPIVTAPSRPGPDGWQSNFTEGQLIDYRAFDVHNITPRYAFGFGLGYAQFALEGELQVSLSSSGSSGTKRPSATPPPAQTIPPGGNPALWDELVVVRTTLRNTGKVKGAGVPQLYVAFPAGLVPHGTPVRVLRGFSKVLLAPGANVEISFSLARRDLSYWDTAAREWVVPRGKFTFSVGFSSRDLRQEVGFDVLGTSGC